MTHRMRIITFKKNGDMYFALFVINQHTYKFVNKNKLFRSFCSNAEIKTICSLFHERLSY